MMRHLFGPFLTGRAAAGLLVIRLLFGLGIAAHGFQKLQAGPFSWFGPGGLPWPMQGLATLAELGGGIGITLGLVTPLAAFGVLCAMCFAMFKVHLPAHEPYVSLSNGPSYELCAHYLAAALAVLLAGPGACSLDCLLFGRRWRANPGAP